MKSLKQLIAFLFHSLLLIVLTACQMTASTPASSAPMLTVREATNCRAGPGTNYDIVFTYPSGTKLQIVGRYEPGDFWQVKSDKSPTGSCWMWGGSVDVTSNAQEVANTAPTAVPTSTSISTTSTSTTPASVTSTPTGPRDLSIVNWEYSCSSGTLTFTVNWKSRLTDEAGFRIFRNGEQIAELPADSTTYTDTLPAGQNLEYYVQVFGPGGTVNSSVMKVGC